LTSADDLLGELDGADAPDLTEFSRAVTYAWGMYWAGRHGPLAAMLPRLLTEAAAATHGAAASWAGRAADLAAQVHQITTGTLLGLGTPDLGYVAAREAVRVAALTSDPLRAAAARNTLSHVLIRQGRFVDAEPADCAVVAEDYVAAAEVARTMPRDSALPVISRCRHLADVAHAKLRLGHDRAAESTLLTMERAASEWTAHHQLPRVLVGELLTRGRPSVRLRELAHPPECTASAPTVVNRQPSVASDHRRQ